MNALIVIDIQNDFIPGGALAVPRGDEVVPIANAMLQKFNLVAATQDWHPSDHGSFARNHPNRKPGEVIQLNGLDQVLWPVHCVQGSGGAEFVNGLEVKRFTKVFQKGTDRGIDSYSGFFDNGHKKSTGLDEFLKAAGVSDVYVLGLATDYCVKFTALDAKQLGFNTYLVEDGCRGVELKPGDCAQAIEEMKAAGVKVVQSTAVK